MELNNMSLSSPPTASMSQDMLNMNNFQILEEGPHVSQDFRKYLTNLRCIEEGTQVSQDVNLRNLKMLEEGPRVCPLCSHEIKMYFINYKERIEMCENVECDYPFGHAPLRIYREENGVQIVEVKSIRSKRAHSTGCSQTSSQGWSDVDKLCNVFDADEVPCVDLSKLKAKAHLKKMESDRRKAELLANVEKIKQMTKNMNEMKQESKRIIKNEKWIKNLQYLEGLSGVRLLRASEMKQIKKKGGSSASGELKIDIDKNNLTSIKIELNRRPEPAV